MKDDKTSEFLRDSAIIITASTALLFVWGYAFEAFRWTGASVPGLFQPEVAVQERALVGGIVALFLFVPIVLAVWAVDKATGQHMQAWLTKTWSRDLVHRTVLVALTFAMSIALVRPVANISDRFGRRLRVESISVNGGAVSPVQKGMYCIGKRDGTYVFVDRQISPQERNASQQS